MTIDTVVGRLDWTSGPVPNVATTPLVGGQWRTGTSSPFELVIVSNRQNPAIPTAGPVESLEPARLSVRLSRSGSGAAARSPR